MQAAAEIYKKLLLADASRAALNYHIALCYAQLDYSDVSNEILAAYLSEDPNSIAATNLRATNLHSLVHGSAALAVIKVGFSFMVHSDLLWPPLFTP